MNGASAALIALRVTLAAPLAAGFVLLARDAHRHHQAEAQWSADVRVRPSIVRERLPGHASPEAWMLAAHAARERLLPPDLPLARRAALKALELDVQSASNWMHLAETELALGNLDAARHALAQSDANDPRYPLQRQSAIQLWTLLGERDRTLALARTLDSLGAAGRAAAIQGLALAGESPADVCQALNLDNTPPEARLDRLAALGAAPGPAAASFRSAAPQGWTSEDSAWRAGLLAVALRGRDWETAMDLWRIGAKQYNLPLVDNNGVLLADPQLSADPAASAGPLGWRTIPRHPLVTSTREAPTADSPGALVFQFERRHADWWSAELLATILPADGARRRLVVDVWVDPPEKHVVELVATVDGRGTRAPVEVGVAGWQPITMDLPAAREGALLVLSLRRERRALYESWETPVVKLANPRVELRP